MSGSENLGRKNLGRETLDDLQAFGSQIGAPGAQMLSAAETTAAAGDLAASLRARVCAPDEPIALFIANEPRDLAGFLGIWLAGCVAAPIHVATPATALTTNVPLSGPVPVKAAVTGPVKVVATLPNASSAVTVRPKVAPAVMLAGG